MFFFTVLALLATTSNATGDHSDGGNGGGKPAQKNAVPALWDGSCYYPKPDIAFDVKSYVGRWYQVAGTTFPYTEGRKCVAAYYSANDDGTIRVNNTGQSGSEASNVIGTATPVDATYGAAGAFQVNFEGAAGSRPPACPGPNYIVQDYTGDWSVVQSNNFSNLFILNRAQNPDPASVEAWINRAGLLGADLSKVIKFDQADCLPLD